MAMLSRHDSDGDGDDRNDEAGGVLWPYQLDPPDRPLEGGSKDGTGKSNTDVLNDKKGFCSCEPPCPVNPGADEGPAQDGGGAVEETVDRHDQQVLRPDLQVRLQK